MIKSKSFMIFSRTGCLLPFLIIFNLFFGWIFFKPLVWLIIEAVLISLFSLNLIILSKKIFSSLERRDGVIDVEGKVVEEGSGAFLPKKRLTPLK